MTYQQLLEKIQQLPADRLQDDVTIFDSFTLEYRDGIDAFCVEEKYCDVLDDGHMVIVMKK
jgi:hypothetical protein